MNQVSDRTKLRRLQARILSRKGLVCCGSEYTVALHSRGKAILAGANRYGQGDVISSEGVAFLACASACVVALMEDGTLRLPSSADPRLTELAHVRSVSCSDTHIAALLGNGRVVVGDNGEGGKPYAADVSEWTEVVDVVCGKRFTAGLTPDGRILLAGGTPHFRYTVARWKDIAGLFSDLEGETLYAVTVDGRLLSTSTRLPHSVRTWRNLTFVAASGKRILAVTATGRLLATCPFSVADSDKDHFVACAVSPRHAVAMTRDGRVCGVGGNEFGQCDVARFGTLFESFDEFAANRIAAARRMIVQEKNYQIRLVEAARYGKRMVCGQRISACIAADGRVLTSHGLGDVRHWSAVRALACGNAHLVALHEEGLVSADGNDTDGCTAVAEWSGIKCIAASRYHTLGVTEDGRVLFCGRNDKGQGDVADWRGIRRVYAADDYTVGLGYDGALQVAGQPPFDPDMIDESWKNPTDVVVTSTHMAALYGDGSVLSTALIPADERLGEGAAWDTRSFSRIRSIAAGEGFTVGLGYGGRVVVAGGDASMKKAVKSWSNVVALSCGRRYVLGLTADGRVLSAGTLRVEKKAADALNPSKSAVKYAHEIPDTGDWREVLALTAGPDHALAMTSEGTILATGLDSDGQCTATTHFTLFRDTRQLYGYGRYRKVSECSLRMTPTDDEPAEVSAEEPTVLSFEEFSAHLPAARRLLSGRFALGMVHSLTLCEEGIVTATGADDSGQCGITSYAGVVQVAAGPYHSAAILADGSLVASGRNADGRCAYRTLNRELDTVGIAVEDSRPGTAQAGDLPSPSHVWLQVACGHEHTVALRSDGRVFAMGGGSDGQCDTRKWRDVQFISCGVRHTVALRTDGTCVATGDNRYGQCDLSLWKNMVMVAAGEFHTVGLRADGRVEVAGDNRKGQCRAEDLRDIVWVACAPEATLCVRADGRVIIRGGDGDMDKAVEALRDVVAIHACEHRIAALTTDRRVVILP